jgi:hypothetical protein
MSLTAIFATLPQVPMPTPWDERYHELMSREIRETITEAESAELDRLIAEKVAIAEGMGL